MKLLSTFRFHDQDQIEGTAEHVDRETRRREQRLRIAMSSDWPELPRGRLEFGRYHITDTLTNELYVIAHGEIDAQHTPAVAYFIDPQGNPIFLERSPAARTVEALAAKRAAREEARAERMRPRVQR